ACRGFCVSGQKKIQNLQAQLSIHRINKRSDISLIAAPEKLTYNYVSHQTPALFESSLGSL
ncbi:hypothetical protein, partial [Pseudomonas syringae]|uniref:hypothetical protein n=1 Tax=Pseudomonas syringae TaxID=317 RepID=UPI001F311218